MNIQQYYEQSATASLNGSLVAFIPSMLLLIYAVATHTYELILLLLPFLIYSFFCYQKFLLNQKRSKAVNLSSRAEDPAAQSFLAEKQLFLTFLPAPSLRLLLFAANGIKIGEIRDQSLSPMRWFLPCFIDQLFVKKFGLYDQNDQPVVFYHYYKDRIELFTATGEAMTILRKLKDGRKQAYMLENKSVIIEKNLLQTDFLFVDSDGEKVAQIQTGWMPGECGERFVNPNTPILELDEHCTRKDKLQLFSLLISIYVYTNH